MKILFLAIIVIHSALLECVDLWERGKPEYVPGEKHVKARAHDHI